MNFIKKQKLIVLNVLFGVLISFFSMRSQAEILGHLHSERLDFSVAGVSSTTLSPNGNYLYVLDSTNLSVLIKKIDSKTGLFLETIKFDVTPFLASTSVFLGSPAVSPDGKYFYFLGFPYQSAVDIFQFRIDSNSGGLSFFEKKSLDLTTEKFGTSISNVSEFYFSENKQFAYIRIILSHYGFEVPTTDTFYTFSVSSQGQLSVIDKSERSDTNYYTANFVILENRQLLYQQGDGHFLISRIHSNGVPVEIMKQYDERLTAPFKMVADRYSQFLYVYVQNITGPEPGEILIYKIGNDGRLAYQSRFVAIYAPYGDQNVLYHLNNFSLSQNNKVLFLNESAYGFVLKLKRNEETGELTFLGLINNETFRHRSSEDTQEFLISPDDRFVYTRAKDLNDNYNSRLDDRLTIFSAYSDLALAQNNLPAEILKEQYTMLEVTVNHAGGADAENVTLTQELPSGLNVVDMTASVGECALSPSNSQEVICRLGALPIRGQAKVTLGLKASSAGNHVVNTSVSHDHVALDDLNHQLKTSVRVVDTLTSSEETTPAANVQASSGGSFGIFLMLLVGALATLKRSFFMKLKQSRAHLE